MRVQIKTRLIRFFRGFSLRQRFLVAPLLALVVCGLLASAFVYESQRQNSLLSRITETDLKAFNHYANVFVELTQQHTALNDLLYGAGKIDEETLYEQTKQHLYQVQQAVRTLQEAVPSGNKSITSEFAELRDELAAAAQSYRTRITAAVEITTVDLTLAPAQLVLANERFTSMNHTFVKFLDLEQEAIISEISARVRQSQIRSTGIAGIGLSVAALLFFLSLLLSRMLTRSIEKQIRTLTALGAQAGARLEVAGNDEVDRMTRAIAAFRQSLVGIKRLNRVYAVLSGINTLIVRVRDRDELFSEACRIAVEHGNFGVVWIGLLDVETDEVTAVAWAGIDAEHVAKSLSSVRAGTPRDEGVTGSAIRQRKPVFSNNITAEPGRGSVRRQEAIRRGYRSAIALPLLVEGSAIGALTLYATEQDFFNEEELRLLAELAADISFAVENIAKQQKLDKLSRVRAVSSEINAAIVRIPERKALLKEVCRIVAEHGKFEMIWVGEIDHANKRVGPVAWSGFTDETAHAVNWTKVGISKGTIGEAIQTRKTSVRDDIEIELSEGPLRKKALEQGCHSSVCLPLVVDDKVKAVIVLFMTGRGFFDKDELTLLDGVASDISFALQAIEKSERLTYVGYYDLITGLANRTLFLERVAQYMRSAASGGHKLAVGLLDLERFKNINDSLGRPAGDALLKQVAEWLTRNLGDPNLAARMGADHFAVVLPEVKQDGDVARLVEKLLKAFLEHPFRLNDAVFRISAKVGVALYPDDGADADTLFRNAEAALKKAKASGDRYLFYTQKMTETVAGKLTLENQLRQALDDEEFVLHYQPKVNLASGKVTGAEALIRWNDPRTGMVPPMRFIPVLEETGMIYEVGRWALRKAIEDYLRWRAAGLAAVPIAVNVSPRQLRNRGFVSEIQLLIGVDAHAAAGLELEITESLIMEDVKHNIASLQSIGALGVTIAIDDFGTGFSSLSYLSKLPVHTLKIDRSFVVDMTAGPEGLALVSTIINLAHSLKLKVVAEGVETEEQSRLLRLLSCDEMQGFLFSKPLPADIFETKFLAAGVSRAEVWSGLMTGESRARFAPRAPAAPPTNE